MTNSFCDWLAARLSPPLARETVPFSLFAHAAIEVDSPRNYTDPYTVIRAFGGAPQRNDPLREINLQVYTVGAQAADCMARAEAIYVAMLGKQSMDDDGDVPVRDQDLGGFVLVALDHLTPPGVIGRDVKHRVEVVFNCSVLYRAKAD